MSTPHQESINRDNLRSLGKMVFLLFLIIAGALFYWSIIQAQSILGRNDNPRLLEQELRIQRGSILDRNEQILAVSEGETQRLQRRYPIPNIGPVVGFYSVLHGTAGAEDGFDEVLRNDPEALWDSLVQDSLHITQEGKNVKLSIDAELQLAADAALNQQHGAVLLLESDADDSRKVWIRALASHPSYNPNTLDEQFDILGSNEGAPLLNRVTQGQYQPGLLLQPFILAAAVDQNLINMSDPVIEPNHPVQVNGINLTCNTPPPETATWADVLKHQCPGPMLELSDQLGIGGLDTIFASFGLDRDPLFELDTTTSVDEPLNDPLLAGIGQDNLSITPLQIGLALSALVNNGELPQPIIGQAVEDDHGNWQPLEQEITTGQATTAQTAANILRALPKESNISEHNPLVLSGPNETINAWYTASMEHEEIDYVIVVVIEGSTIDDQATAVGRRILSAVREIEAEE